MARTPSQTPEEALAEIGIKRGNMKFVAPSKVLSLRRFLTAMGIPGAHVARMTRAEWLACFNDLTNTEIGRHIAAAGVNALEGVPVDGEDVGEEANPVMPEAPTPAAIVNNPVINPAPASFGTLDAAIEMIVERVLAKHSPTIDADAVRDIVQRELGNIEPREVVFKHADDVQVKIDIRTPLWFERVVKLLKYGEKKRVNVCLVGPAGCGKTHLSSYIAKALGCERYTILSGSAGATESDIKGKLLPTGEGGAFEYHASDFVSCYEKGSALIVLDEIDAFDDNMLMCANVPLANGCMYVHQRYTNPKIERGENVYFLATANTYGTNATPIYSSRNKLDGATLDRFLQVSVDYDTRYEEEEAIAGGLTAAELGRLWDLRAKVRDQQLRRVISTRAIFKAAVMKLAGDDWSTIVDTLTAGWSRDERQKVGLN